MTQVRIGVDVIYGIGRGIFHIEFAGCRIEERPIDLVEWQAIGAGVGGSGDHPALVDLVISRVCGALGSGINGSVIRLPQSEEP